MSDALQSELAAMQQKAAIALLSRKEGEVQVNEQVPQAVNMALANKLSAEQVLRGQYRVAKEEFEKAVEELELTKGRYEEKVKKLKEAAITVKKIELPAVTVFTDNIQPNNYGGHPPTHAQYLFLRALDQERYIHWLVLAQKDIVASTQAEATLLGQKLMTMHAEVKQLEEMVAKSNGVATS